MNDKLHTVKILIKSCMIACRPSVLVLIFPMYHYMKMKYILHSLGSYKI